MHPISGKLKAWDVRFGNFPCNHIGCEAEADYIVGSNHHDYSHFCMAHIDEYDNESMRIIPVIRGVKAHA